MSMANGNRLAEPAAERRAHRADPLRADREHATFANGGRLHWMHWAIVVSSLGLTVLAWQYSKNQIELRIEARFDREAERIPELMDERMELYENALLSGVAEIKANGGNVSYHVWKVFSDSLGIDERYPGINGIGVIDSISREHLPEYLAGVRARRPDFSVQPEHNQSQLWPIRLVEPLEKNAQAIGLDIAHESNRRTGAEKARDTGTPQVTGPIVLVQDQEKTSGFLFFAPFYSAGTPDTLEDRRMQFSGLVYAPFIVSNLVGGTLRKGAREVAIKISDSGTVIYDEHLETDPNYDPHPLFARTTTHNVYGRNWEFDIRTTRAFRVGSSTSQPLIILAIGLVIDILLLSLFVLLTRANRRAVVYADRVTAKLRERTKALETSNGKLEKFAYVASHDLKTPLRGIADLTEYLEEDLEAYLETGESGASVKRNLARVRIQVDRMNALIKGILDYSGVGFAKRTRALVDLDELVAATMTDMGVDPGKWRVEGEPQVFETDVVHFSQIVSNLLSNAVKYHGDPCSVQVDVSIAACGEHYKVSVADNGPGIEPRFHQRIFEVFQTLQPKDEVEGTGIGLAIVKRVLDDLGESISIRSMPGEGSTFEFTWPMYIDFDDDMD